MICVVQNAGNQLKSLQKALKNPIGNAGLLAGEITKRAKRLHHSHTHTHADRLCVGCVGVGLSREQEALRLSKVRDRQTGVLVVEPVPRKESQKSATECRKNRQNQAQIHQLQHM